HAPWRREPDGPDREGRKCNRQTQAQAGPWQVRVVDGESGPQHEHDPAQKPDPRDQPGKKPIQKVAVWAQSFLSFLAVSERPSMEIAESETSREEEHCDFSLAIGQSCCGRPASLARFLSLATRFRFLQGELVCAAVDWAAPACLRSACHRLAGE